MTQGKNRRSSRTRSNRRSGRSRLEERRHSLEDQYSVNRRRGSLDSLADDEAIAAALLAGDEEYEFIKELRRSGRKSKEDFSSSRGSSSNKPVLKLGRRASKEKMIAKKKPKFEALSQIKSKIVESNSPKISSARVLPTIEKEIPKQEGAASSDNIKTFKTAKRTRPSKLKRRESVVLQVRVFIYLFI